MKCGLSQAVQYKHFRLCRFELGARQNARGFEGAEALEGFQPVVHRRRRRRPWGQRRVRAISLVALSLLWFSLPLVISIILPVRISFSTGGPRSMRLLLVSLKSRAVLVLVHNAVADAHHNADAHADPRMRLPTSCL